MPVRKIRRNYLFVTGNLSSSKNERMVDSEGTLEPDFYKILEVDRKVIRFEEQPVRIPYELKPGMLSYYTPDVLVFYRDINSLTGEYAVLYEIKNRKLIKEQWAEYKLKFRAARKYARQQGWRFKLITDREIRTPYLENAKKLLLHKNNVISPDMRNAIIDYLGSVGTSTIQEMVNSLAGNGLDKMRLFSALWHLLAVDEITSDLHAPILMTSSVALAGNA